MDAASFANEIEGAKAVELDRLGSQQSLVALTDADLDAETVLRAAARSERAARETFSEWAEREVDAAEQRSASNRTQSDDLDASEAFAALAGQEADHYERVVDEVGEEFTPSDAVDPITSTSRTSTPQSSAPRGSSAGRSRPTAPSCRW